MKVGDIVPERWRNPEGIKAEYPYTFAHNLEGYLIWHRETGEVIYIIPGLGAPAYRKAYETCRVFNGEYNG